MKILMSVIIVGFMAVAGLSLFMNAARADLKTEKLEIVTKDGKKHSFDVEIAATPTDQEVGLNSLAAL